jgi:tRNA(Ser,Leu) C12 N-acetylase TAN1
VDWNVVATVESEGYRDARQLLGRYGKVGRTDFYNVLVLRVDDPRAFLAAFADLVAREPGTLNTVSHLTPADRTFSFASADEFEEQARAVVCDWAPRIAGKVFHVRMHRRGFKGSLSSAVEERFLDDALLDAAERVGAPARIGFDDAEVIISIQTVGNRAGVSLWARADLERCPFLDID